MKKIYYTFAALLIFMSACKKEASIKGEQQGVPGKTITYHLKNGGEVTVSINNRGEYVVGGDVILSKDQVAYLEYNKVGSGKETTPRSTYTSDFNKLWPGGVVYYTISDQSKASLIIQAINHWEAQTPIRFIQWTNQINYVDFSGNPSQGAGSSALGMINGRQYIKLASNSVLSNVIHEIGHAVGLMHEHTRADRDNYINVSNVNNSWKPQYAIYSAGTGGELGPLDYESIMIYSSYNSDASDGSSAPQLTRKDGTTWNRMSVLSPGDINGINSLYKKIYARLVYDYISNEQSPDGSYYSSQIAYYLKFYTDETLTIPSALTYKVKVSYTMRNKTLYHSNLVDNHSVLYTKVLQPGENTYYLDTSNVNLIVDYGMESGTMIEFEGFTILHPNYFYNFY